MNIPCNACGRHRPAEFLGHDERCMGDDLVACLDAQLAKANWVLDKIDAETGEQKWDSRDLLGRIHAVLKLRGPHTENVPTAWAYTQLSKVNEKLHRDLRAMANDVEALLGEIESCQCGSQDCPEGKKYLQMKRLRAWIKKVR